MKVKDAYGFPVGSEENMEQMQKEMQLWTHHLNSKYIKYLSQILTTFDDPIISRIVTT